jgi:glycosyltransferase involved in cell wall biosynthesis
MKIAVVVHGRFYGFDLARSLLARGHDAHVFTNYPVWAVKPFGIPAERVRSFWPHGVASRAFDRMGLRFRDLATPFLHRAFSRWAMKAVRQETWDVINAFSGVAEDLFRGTPEVPCHLVVRGSAHIRRQRDILREESARTGVMLDSPCDWMVEREEREYRMCDRVVVLSRFAWQSFVEAGVPAGKLAMLPLGVDLRAFRPSHEVLAERRRRIQSGAPLRVIYTGNLSFRKGLYDFDKIVRAVDPRRFHFQVIGSVAPEVAKFAAELPSSVELVPHQPEAKLPQWYTGGDLFLFPTLEDGFAAVLTQACASGLPILATTNCGAPDFVRDGQNGWVLPIRDAGAFIDRLNWCDEHREEVAEMADRIYKDYHPRDWNDVAADFETIVKDTGRPGNG